MDKQRIITALNEALAGYPTPDAHLTTMVLLNQAEIGAKTDPRIDHLLQSLRAEPELREFDGKMQMVPNGANKLEYTLLAGWLMQRARASNVEQALNNLDTYLKADNLPCESTLALVGIAPESVSELGPQISLVPWDSLRDSSQKQSVWQRFVTTSPAHMPNGALVRQFTVLKRHISYEEFQREFQSIAPVNETDLYDALLCLTLVGPCAPHVVAGWVSLPEWAPQLGGSLTLPQPEGFSPTRPFTGECCAQAKHLFTAFTALKTPLRNRLRLVMQRLNRAMRRGVPVDAAIDLGIALEGLFLGDMPDDRGELTFRLRIRAARFLGGHEADRKALFALVGDLYGMRSSAAHTGAVAATIRGQPAQHILEKGYALAANAIRQFILHGEPNWDKILFS